MRHTVKGVRIHVHSHECFIDGILRRLVEEAEGETLRGALRKAPLRRHFIRM